MIICLRAIQQFLHKPWVLHHKDSRRSCTLLQRAALRTISLSAAPHTTYNNTQEKNDQEKQQQKQQYLTMKAATSEQQADDTEKKSAAEASKEAVARSSSTGGAVAKKYGKEFFQQAIDRYGSRLSVCVLIDLCVSIFL